MTDTCGQALECCPPAVWQEPPPGIEGQLSRLVWWIPADALGHCVDPDPVATVLNGTPGEVYTVTLRIRGIVEFKGHAGGIVQPDTGGLCVLGGTPNGSTFNDYRLTISDPPQTFYMNVGAETSRQVVDYELTVDMIAGATVTMTALTLDNLEHVDPAGLVITPGPNDPPIAFPQPLQGQALQLDAIAVE